LFRILETLSIYSDPMVGLRDLTFVVVFLRLRKDLYEQRSENVFALCIFRVFFFLLLTLNKNISDLIALLPTSFLFGPLQN
jgi:hypothetical protein